MGWIANKRIRQLAAVWKSLQRRPAGYAHFERELLFEIRCLEERRVLNGAPVAAHGQGHAGHDNSQSIPGSLTGTPPLAGDGSNAHSANPLPGKTNGSGHHASGSFGTTNSTPPTNLPASEGYTHVHLDGGNSHPATNSVSVTPQISAATASPAITPDGSISGGGGNTITVPGPQTIDQDDPLVLSGVSFTGSNLDSYSVSIDWGDGSGVTAGTLIQDPTTPGVLDVQGQHTYSATNPDYVVTISVTDQTTSTAYTNGTFLVAVNAPPLATDLNYSTADDVPLNVSATDGLLTGYTGTTPATFTLLSNPIGTDGTVTVNPDGSFQYVPDGQVGTDTFTYQVSDGIDTTTANLIITTTASLTDTTPLQTFNVVEGTGIGPVVLATFTDANQSAVAADYNVSVTNWGGLTEGTPTVSVQEVGMPTAAGSTWEVLGTVTYAEANTAASTPYQVTVQIKDVTGGDVLTSSQTSFNVTDAPLTDTSTAQTLSVVEGASTGQVVLATFTDADPYALAADYNVSVTNWGGQTEGTPTVSVQEVGSPTAAGSTWEVLGTVTYAEANSAASTPYQVTVQIKDVTGGDVLNSSQTSFNVTDAPLTDTSTTQTLSVVEGASTGQVVLATFTDADQYAVAADYNVSVTNWGGVTEGTPTVSIQEVGTPTAAGSTWEVLGTVTYAEANTAASTPYQVTVQIKDVTGGDTLTSTATQFTVTDAPLTDTSTAQTLSVVEGASTGQVVLATFTDADPYALAADYNVSVTNWGGLTEGTPTVSVQEVGTPTAAGSTWEVLGTVTYAEANSAASTPYQVTVQIKDVTGGDTLTSTATKFNVTDAPLTDTSTAQTLSVVEGASTGQVVLATFTDADQYAVAADYNVSVTNWGGVTEGTPTVSVQEVGMPTAAGSTWEVLGTVTYAEANSAASTPYQVTVQIKDVTGGDTLTSTATKFSVTDAPLTDTSTSQTLSVVEGASTGQVVLATFTDADPYAVAADYNVSVTNWGGLTEGTPTVSVQEVGTPTVAGSTWEVLGTVTYAEANTATSTPYQVTVQVKDVTGGDTLTSTATKFSVTDAPLTDTSTAQTLSVVEGASTGQVVLATFTDADPYAVAADYSVSVTNWGGLTEGTPTVSVQEVGTPTAAGSTWEVLGTVTYAEANSAASTPYQVTVQIKDVTGGDVLTSSQTSFNVTDAPLTETSTAQTLSVVEGASTGQVVLATFTDADPYAVAADYNVSVTNWGGLTEGTPTVSVQEVGAPTAAGSTWEVLGTVTYAEANTAASTPYQVTVQIKDVTGGDVLNSAQTSFTVTDAPLADTSTAQTLSVVEGASTGQVVLATFTDADPYAVAADYNVSVTNWGGLTEGTPTVSVQEVGTPTAAGSTWEVLGTVTYAEANTAASTPYQVTVQVKDVTGGDTLTSTATQFTVTDAPLTDTSTAQTLSVVEGASTGQVVLATFTDADPYAVAADYNVSVTNWGGLTEGTPTVSVQEVGAPTAAGSTWEVLGTVTYAEANTATSTPYQVTVQIKDVTGGDTLTSTATKFNVTDAPLTDTSTAQTLSVVEGASTGQVVLATFTDADPYAVAADYSVSVTNWGGLTEGTPTVSVQEVGAPTAAGSAWEVLGTVTYAEANTAASTPYQVTVQIKDVTGGDTLTSTATQFTVTDAPLTDTSTTQTLSVVEGASTGQVVLATFTDADPYALAADYNVSVTNWGGLTEGTPTVSVQEVGTPTAAGSTWEVLGTVTYAEANSAASTPYQVTVQIKDVTGGDTLTSTATKFTVTDAPLADTSTAQTLSVVEGASTGQVVLATFTDADPYALATDYNVSVTNWGGVTEGTPTVSVQEVGAPTAAGSTWEVLGTVTYAEANTAASTPYQVTVQIKDVTGGDVLNSAQTSFTVTDAPLADTSTAQTLSVVEGASTGQVVLATFTDADPYAVAADYNVSVTNWGGLTEGTPTVSVQEVGAPTAAGSTWEVLGTVTYAEANSAASTPYQVTVQIKDVTGGDVLTSSQTSFNVTDAPLTDTSTAQTLSVVEGASTGQVVLATFTDADPYALAADYNVSVTNWGGQTEGTPTVSVQEVGSPTAAGSTWEVLGTVTYAEANTATSTPYQVTVQIKDVTGGDTLTSTATQFTVTDAPLTDTSTTQTLSVVEGASTGQVMLTTFTDADPYAVAADYNVSVTNWGGLTEGTPTVSVQEVGTPTAAGSTWEVLGTVTYAEANTAASTPYQVTVQVKDVTGGDTLTSTATQFTVTDAPLTDTSTAQTLSVMEGASTGQVVLATFTDADPYAVAADYNVSVTNWGGLTEGTPTVSVQEVGAPTAAGSTWEVLGTVTYAEANTAASTPYQVTVQIKDVTGGDVLTSSQTSFNVTDAPLTDTSTAQTLSVVEGASTGQVVLATFTDADPYAVAADYNVSVTNWGGVTEGTPTVSVQEVGAPTAAGSTWEVLGTVTYAEANTAASMPYQVTVQIKDVTGGDTLTSISTQFTVTDAPLTDTSTTQTLSVVEGASTGQVVLATFTDADPYALAADYSVSVTNWGGVTEGTPTVSVQEVGMPTAAGSTWEVLGTVTYAEANTATSTPYQVTVQIKDVTGGDTLTSTATQFTVTDAPLADTSTTQTLSVVEGASTGQVVLTTFTDADPYAVAADYNVSVTNWGGVTEGTPTVSVQEVGTPTAAGSTWEVLGTVTYAEANTAASTPYQVTVQIKDVTGGDVLISSQTSFNVTDAPLTNTTSVQTYDAVRGFSTGQVVLATFTDADPYAVASDYTAVVNWGGTLRGASTVTFQEVSTSATGSTWEVLGTATYDNYGSFNVTVQVNDFGGSTFTTNNTSFAVSDPAVIVSPVTLSTPVGANSGVQTVATFTDPGGAQGLSHYVALINWGDGTSTVSGNIVFDATTGVFSVQGSHVYGYDTSYPVTVTILHDVAPNASAISTAVVTDVPPTLTTTPTYTAVGQGSLVTLANINFSDPAFPVLANTPTFTYSIDWADGTPIQTGVAPVTQIGSVGVPTLGAFNLSHVYEMAGSYSAILTVYDHDGKVATTTVTIVIPEIPPVVSGVSFTELNVLSQTTATGTVYDPGNDSLTVTINWGDNTTSVLTLPGGVTDTFVVQHQYIGPPNPADPAAPISVSVAVNDHIDVFGRIEVGQVVTQVEAVQVPGTGVVFVTFFPEPKAPPLALAQAVLTERNSFISSPSPQAAAANELIVVRVDQTGAAEDRVVLRLVSPDGKDANDVALPGNVLDDLPGFLKRLPDGRYRIFYIQGDTHRERMIIDVNVRGGRPVDADEDSGGTQDRPPNAQFQSPRPSAAEESTDAKIAVFAALNHEAELSRPDLRPPTTEAFHEQPVGLAAGYGLLATSLMVARARSKAVAARGASSADPSPIANSRSLSKAARLMQRVRKAYRPK